ncbi:MAG: hypothetical protein OHK0057_01960 [Thermoflexibacter sp.]
MKTTYGLPKKREEVIQELQTAFANQNLDDAEYESRLNEALAAKSIEDLEVIVCDFPLEVKHKLFPKELAPAPSQEVTSSNSSLPSSSLQSINSYRVILGDDKRQIALLDASTQHFITILGNQKIDLRKSILQSNHLKINVENLLGSTIIDLRNENLEGKHIDIWVGGMLGDIKIFIPQGGSIQREAQMFAGNFTVKDKRKNWLSILTGSNQEEKPLTSFTLTIRGSYWLGNVEIAY